MRTRWGPVALAAAAAGGGLVLAGPAPSAGAAACSGTSGVTVVVDFGSLGGGVQTTCAAGDPASGLAALTGGGHTYSFVPRQPGLVCQIDTRPDPCNGAPVTAYWAYWHAVRGGSWSYSTLGAGGYNPAPGTVEGWAFGAGRQPGIAPPAAPAPATTAAPAPAIRTTARAPAPATSAGATAAPRPPAAGGSRPTASAPAGSARSATATRRKSASASGTGTPPATASPTGARPSASAEAGPQTPATEPAGSSTPAGTFAAGVAVVAALATAGVLLGRRRRATGRPPL